MESDPPATLTVDQIRALGREAGAAAAYHWWIQFAVILVTYMVGHWVVGYFWPPPMLEKQQRQAHSQPADDWVTPMLE